MAETRKLAAILAADVVGYSRLTGADEDRTLARLRALRSDLIDPTIAVHHGRVIKRTGDGALVEFRSVVDAVRCAIEVQSGMLERNAGVPAERRIEFRIGIHLGDVVEESDGDLMGDGVNIAARLEGVAKPNGICLSEDAYRQVRARLDFAVNDLGPIQLKNIAEPVRAYSLEVGSATHVKAAAGLPQVSVPSTAPRLSVVVLPFSNIGGDPDQEYFVDGVTESLTTDLSRIAGSFVIARNTAFTYKGKPVNAKQLGRELGVRFVLEGSVRRSGNQVRISVQLVDAETGAELWADRFDREAQQLLGMESEITGRIARTVRARMVTAEARRVTKHPDALDYIFRGRAALFKPVSLATSDEAIGDFEQALALDPKAVRAEIGLASALISRVLDEFSSDPVTDLQRAESLLDQALAAAPESAWAHYVKGQLARAQGHCEDAIPEYEAAITLDRNSAPSYGWLGWCRFLDGEIDKTIALEQQAIRLSPQDRSIGAWYGRIGMVHLLEGRTSDAIVWLEKARATYLEQSHEPVYIFAWLAAAYALDGDRERSGIELEQAWQRGFYRSMSGLDKDPWYNNRKVRALAEKTYFVGLRKAGMPQS